jgi:hypothetical protein
VALQRGPLCRHPTETYQVMLVLSSSQVISNVLADSILLPCKILGIFPAISSRHSVVISHSVQLGVSLMDPHVRVLVMRADLDHRSVRLTDHHAHSMLLLGADVQ